MTAEYSKETLGNQRENTVADPNRILKFTFQLDFI